DHVPCLAQHHRVADEHALGPHHVLVVQRGLPHFATGYVYRFHHGVRGGPAGATHTDGDVQQLGVDFFGGVLIGGRPAGSPAGGSELGVQSQLIDLDHDAV